MEDSGEYDDNAGLERTWVSAGACGWVRGEAHLDDED